MDVGHIGGPYGIRGWLKVVSATQPSDNIFRYQPWWLKTPQGLKAVQVDAHRTHGKGFVVHLAGIDDRNGAEAIGRAAIAIEKESLPELPGGEYYWHQLFGLRVFTRVGTEKLCLGSVESLLETGANDVLVVRATEDSVDMRERLIPYIPGQYVLEINPDAGIMLVDWDPQF